MYYPKGRIDCPKWGNNYPKAAQCYPKATRQEVADALDDIIESGVKFNIGLQQQYKALKRKGGRKNGEGVVLYMDDV